MLGIDPLVWLGLVFTVTMLCGTIWIWRFAWRQIGPYHEQLSRLAQKFEGELVKGFLARTAEFRQPEFKGKYGGYSIRGTMFITGSHSLNFSDAFKSYPSSLSITLTLDQSSLFNIGFINNSFDKVLFGKTFKTQDPELDQKFSMYTYRLDPAKRYVADSKNLGAVREIYNQGWELGGIGKKTVSAGLDFKWGEFDPSMIEAEPVKKCLDQLIILAEGLKRGS